jgi:hypothetical protein
MNPRKTTIAILAALSVSLALAEDFKTVNGKEYKNATVSRVEPDGLVLKTKSGISKVYFAELPKEVREQFHYVEPAKGAAHDAAVEGKQRDAAILTKAEQEFETAEMRTQHAYEGSEKGTLSGQIFVTTKGRENVKLGASQISLFASDAVDTLMSGLYAYAAAKTERLQSDLAAANAAEQQTRAELEQATATEKNNEELYKKGFAGSSTAVTAVSVAKEAASRAKEAHASAKGQVESLLAKLRYYHSQDFYFSHLRSPVLTVESDADGKFTIQVPRTGEYVIAAQTERLAPKETERYYWLQPVALNGQQQAVLNLSNLNLYLVRTPGAD